MSELPGGSYLPSLPPFPDDHDVLSFLTFSLREPGAEVALALGLPWGWGWGRGSPGFPPLPGCSAHVQLPDLSFQPLSLPAHGALLRPSLVLGSAGDQR